MVAFSILNINQSKMSWLSRIKGSTRWLTTITKDGCGFSFHGCASTCSKMCLKLWNLVLVYLTWGRSCCQRCRLKNKRLSSNTLALIKKTSWCWSLWISWKMPSCVGKVSKPAIRLKKSRYQVEKGMILRKFSSPQLDNKYKKLGKRIDKKS